MFKSHSQNIFLQGMTEKSCLNADIIHKYTPEEASSLREYGELGPDVLDTQLPSGIEEHDNEMYDDIKFDDI